MKTKQIKKMKKCPTCKGKGQVKIDALGLTQEELRKESQMCWEQANN
jgi:DnaJ-class molecular chaperone